MANAKKNALSVRKFAAIALVGRGDNPNANVLFAKNADEDAEPGTETFSHVAKAQPVEMDLDYAALESEVALSDGQFAKNWVTDTGGAIPYIKRIHDAILRDSPESAAKADPEDPDSGAWEIAVGIVRDWAEGRRGAKPDTVTKAAAAIAAFDAARAAAKADNVAKSADEDASDTDGPAGDSAPPTLTGEKTTEGASMPEPVKAEENEDVTKDAPADPDAPSKDAPEDAPAKTDDDKSTDKDEDKDADALDDLDFSKEQAEFVKELLEDLDALEAEVETLRAGAVETVAKSAEQTEEKRRESLIAKHAGDTELLEDLRKSWEAQDAATERADEAERIAKEAEEERIEKRYADEALSFRGMGVEETAIAKALRDLNEHCDQATIDAIGSVLATSNSRFRKSAFLVETGIGTDVETSIAKSFEAAVEEIQKSDPSLTDAEARVKAYETNRNFAMNTEEN